MVVKCTSARQFTGQGTIGELLLEKAKKDLRQKGMSGLLLTPPQKISDVMSLSTLSSLIIVFKMFIQHVLDRV